MPRNSVRTISAGALLALSVAAAGQTKPAPVDNARAVEHAIDLARQGQCAEALPRLDKLLGTISDKDVQRQAGIAGVRCGMTLDDRAAVGRYVAWLNRKIPHDPEILYLTIHAYTDLSMRASGELVYTNPGAPQLHQLNAEALEAQGKWKEAMDEYRVVLQRAPNMRGIHFQIGRAILSAPPTPTMNQDARKEFEEELKIDPNNAGAEYVLGELARQEQQLPEAIEHFTRATKLDRIFTDAYTGLARALLDSDRTADAVAPLEMAVKLQPENPGNHFLLANAYQRVGRKEEAAREFAAHQAGLAKAKQMSDDVRHGIAGAPPPQTPPQK